jgi:hypothetical protein
VKVLGIRSYKNKIAWSVVEGAARATATVVAHDVDLAPNGTRGEVLHWVRGEIEALINQHQPDTVVLCPTEGGQGIAMLERSQVDGVIIETTYAMGKTTTAKKSATIRSNFSAKSKAALAAAVNVFPAISGIAPNADRREPSIAALSAIP